MAVDEDIELRLRREGKDHCSFCGYNIHRSEISLERYKRWIEDREQPSCLRCRKLRKRRKNAILTLLLIIVTILLLIFSSSIL